jgi:hypothetical protein
MEADREQPASEVLLSDAARPATSRKRSSELGAHLDGHFQSNATDGGVSDAA